MRRIGHDSGIDACTLVDREGLRVVRVLDRLAETIGLPNILAIDNGPEFSAHALDTWAYTRGVQLRFIRPGKTIENAFVESFNGKFRDECLNDHWFASVAEARMLIEAWRVDYFRASAIPAPEDPLIAGLPDPTALPTPCSRSHRAKPSARTSPC